MCIPGYHNVFSFVFVVLSPVLYPLICICLFFGGQAVWVKNIITQDDADSAKWRIRISTKFHKARLPKQRVNAVASVGLSHSTLTLSYNSFSYTTTTLITHSVLFYLVCWYLWWFSCMSSQKLFQNGIDKHLAGFSPTKNNAFHRLNYRRYQWLFI